MREKYQKALMWALYALLFLFVMVMQTVVFGNARFYGVKLALLPVALVCIAMHTDPEGSALFALIACTVWCLTGADGGTLYILFLTPCAAVCSWLCIRYFNRSVIIALLLSLAVLIITQVLFFLFKVYMGIAVISTAGRLPVQILLSLLACPPVYAAAWAIRKAGP